MSKSFSAASALIGTIIGAGILGIPYVVMKSGFILGLLNIIFVFVIITLTMLYLGEIALRTKKNHQLPGYAEKYLGDNGKIVMFIALIFGIYTSTVAYLIGEGESLSQLLFNNTQHSLILGISFWIFMSIICYLGLKALEDGSEIGIVLIAILLISLIILFWNKIEVSNLSYAELSNFFTPFGVILFAFLGFAAIPEVERILGPEKQKTKKTIIGANISVLIIYTLFTLIVLGSQGANTPEIATLNLGKIFIILGMVTMFTSYLALSIALIDTFKFDFGYSKTKSWILTIIPPLGIYIFLNFINSSSFSLVLSIGGLLSGGLTTILILFMLKNAKEIGERKPEYSIPYSPILNWILIIIFSLAALLEIIKLFF